MANENRYGSCWPLYCRGPWNAVVMDGIGGSVLRTRQHGTRRAFGWWSINARQRRRRRFRRLMRRNVKQELPRWCEPLIVGAFWMALSMDGTGRERLCRHGSFRRTRLRLMAAQRKSRRCWPRSRRLMRRNGQREPVFQTRTAADRAGLILSGSVEGIGYGRDRGNGFADTAASDRRAVG